jgi:hypothetical protein
MRATRALALDEILLKMELNTQYPLRQFLDAISLQCI